jgi:hypothetical protein
LDNSSHNNNPPQQTHQPHETGWVYRFLANIDSEKMRFIFLGCSPKILNVDGGDPCLVCLACVRGKQSFCGSELDILLRNVSHQDGWFKIKQGMITCVCVCVFQSLLISYTTVCLVKNQLGYVATAATIIVNKKQSTKSSLLLHVVLPWGIKKESITKKNITKTRPKNKQTNKQASKPYTGGLLDLPANS